MNEEVFFDVIIPRICELARVPRPLFLITDWFEPFVPTFRIRYLIEGNIFYAYHRSHSTPSRFVNIVIFDANGKWDDDHKKDSRFFWVAFKRAEKITRLKVWLCLKKRDGTLENVRWQLFTHRSCPAIAYESVYAFDSVLDRAINQTI